MSPVESFARSRIATVLLVLCLCCPSIKALRNGSNGEVWVKWTPEIRTIYIRGYVTGLYEGIGAGCHEVISTISPPRSWSDESKVLTECSRKFSYFKGDPIRFVPLITKFYRAYPTQRSIDIRDVLYEAAKGLPVAQIHEHFLQSNLR
jgi:hypothetical protein